MSNRGRSQRTVTLSGSPGGKTGENGEGRMSLNDRFSQMGDSLKTAVKSMGETGRQERRGAYHAHGQSRRHNLYMSHRTGQPVERDDSALFRDTSGRDRGRRFGVRGGRRGRGGAVLGARGGHMRRGRPTRGTIGRGQGARRGSGRGGRGRGGRGGPPATAEQLDADLDSYHGQDPTVQKQQLDDQLDQYGKMEE